MKQLFGLWLLCIGFQVEISGQFSDDFSDGNLDGWQGNLENFIINGTEELQLNAPSGSSASWIFTPLTLSDSMVWDLYLKLDFAPSTSNQLRIYLGLTSSELATASGYLLEIGASGDQDALELKYFENGTSIPIAASAPGFVASEPVELSLRVIRNSQGLWKVFKNDASLPELLFTSEHSNLPLSSLNTFGFYAKYTDTRRDKFFFDDIFIAPLQSDQTPPSWLAITVMNHNTVNLLFDENLDPVSSIAPSHYILTPGNLMPDEIIYNGNEISLSWNSSFVSQQNYLLSINNILDPSGNILVSDTKNFVYDEVIDAGPFDLLFTEIMADPTPVTSLPDAEYLEIFNNTTNTFNLGEYKIKIGTTEKTLPDSLIHPGEYVILTDDGNAPLLSTFGRIIAMQSMPTLTNQGTTLALIQMNGGIIHEVTYADSWYRDPNKSNGGWSLEMLNPNHICSNQQNWSAPLNFQGGTPGTMNTQWTTSQDLQGPELLFLFAAPNHIELVFDEKLEPILMLNPNIYVFEPELTIGGVTLTSPTTIEINLTQPLQAGINYKLLPLASIDCLGNPSMSEDTTVFGVVVPAEPGDVFINEILFNPATAGNRFIEIINPSQKFINLSTLAIGRITGTDSDIFPTGLNNILAPGDIVVFTQNPSDIQSRFTVPNPSKLYSVSSMPSWNDKSDHVALFSLGQTIQVIDSFTYSSSWHHPAISDQNGVSLERISTGSSTSSSSNWHSASSVSGNATPTGVNSQSVPLGEGETPFSITNKQFSPDGDGFKDYLLIDFSLSSGDDVGSVWVHDLEGRLIRELLSNESLGTSALVQWDGTNTENKIADMGMYIIFVQLWDPAGNVKEYQESCALIKRP